MRKAEYERSRRNGFCFYLVRKHLCLNGTPKLAGTDAQPLHREHGQCPLLATSLVPIDSGQGAGLGLLTHHTATGPWASFQYSSYQDCASACSAFGFSLSKRQHSFPVGREGIIPHRARSTQEYELSLCTKLGLPRGA